MIRLNLCKPGKYRIRTIKPWSKRLHEMGFTIDKTLYVIANTSLGIRIRIDNAVYLVNEITAMLIYVELNED
jgi:Fe2+ transport system protein FeoA